MQGIIVSNKELKKNLIPEQENKALSIDQKALMLSKYHNLICQPKALENWEVKQSVTIILKVCDLVKQFNEQKKANSEAAIECLFKGLEDFVSENNFKGKVYQVFQDLLEPIMDEIKLFTVTRLNIFITKKTTSGVAAAYWAFKCDCFKTLDLLKQWES